MATHYIAFNCDKNSHLLIAYDDTYTMESKDETIIS